ncbi:MAG: hypothetical protein RLY87_292 [Chloroflexota bacterium]
MRALLLLMLAFLSVACSSPQPYTAQNTDVRVVLHIDEQSLGFRSGTVEVTDLGGKSITDARVTLTAVMKQHGMINPPLTLNVGTNGYTYTDLEINMVGEWQMQVRVERSTLNTVIEIPIVFE